MVTNYNKLITPPIFVFQMGKVGSSSLNKTLTTYYNGNVVHAHNEQMLTESQKKILIWRKRFRQRIYVICPIRDPLSRNISAFFQNFKRDTGYEISDHQWSVNEILNLFLHYYPHNVCLEWFDTNLRTTFGIDVYSEPFPADQKWKIYKKRSIHVLVYRTDIEPSKQLEVISKFIGYKIPDWIYGNLSSSKSYSDLYKKVTDTIKLPEIYLSIICKSRFCRHFWTKEEIDSFVREWHEYPDNQLLNKLL